MTGTDFGMGQLAWLAIIGIIAIILAIPAAGYGLYWLWSNVEVIIK